jgi:hypothetical protein
MISVPPLVIDDDDHNFLGTMMTVMLELVIAAGERKLCGRQIPPDTIFP